MEDGVTCVMRIGTMAKTPTSCVDKEVIPVHTGPQEEKNSVHVEEVSDTISAFIYTCAI